MVFGSVMLVDSPVPELQLGWPFILSSMGALALITLGLARLGIKAQRTQSVTGTSGMLDEDGVASSAIPVGGSGRVMTHGETWMAKSNEDIRKGDTVRVVAIDGMMLTVSRKAESVGEEG